MLTWSQLGHAPPKESDLVRLARSAPRDQLLRGLTTVATVLLNADNKAGGLAPPAHLSMAHALLGSDLFEVANSGFKRRQWQVFLRRRATCWPSEPLPGSANLVLLLRLPSETSQAGPHWTANDLLDTGRSEVDIVGRLLRLWWFARHDQARVSSCRATSAC